MLTIKRIPTTYSLQQLSQDGGDKANSTKALLNKESLKGAHLPLLQCQGHVHRSRKRIRSHDDSLVPDISETSSGSEDDLYEPSLFETVLKAEWDRRSEFFRYDVTECSTKILPGKLGFVAQLNEGRAAKKRPTEFRVDKVLQEFDASKFNFQKAAQVEVIFQFCASGLGPTVHTSAARVKPDAHMVLINVSPIEYGHILLVPRLLDGLPQQIQTDSLTVALEMCAEANNPCFRLGYNSLGAYATINHLHFQGYYLTAPFPVERAATARLSSKTTRRPDFTLSRLLNYPVRGLVFEAGSSLFNMSIAIANACIRLQDRDIAFNLFIVDRGTRVFLFPQCFATRQAKGLVSEDIIATQVNPAAFEIAGHIVLKRAKDYENATEDFAWNLLSEVSLSESAFEEVCEICLSCA